MLWRDERAVSAVIAKTLAAGLTMLYIAGMTGLLFGNIGPAYESATDEELSERVLATTADTVDQSVPDARGSVNATRSVSVPPTIDDERYRIHLSDRQLRLDHPSDSINESIQLAVPPGTTIESGAWESGDEFRVRVSGSADNRTIQLEQ